MQVAHRNFQIEDIFFLSFQGVSFQNNLSKNLTLLSAIQK